MSPESEVNYLYSETHTTVGALMEVLKGLPDHLWVMIHCADIPALVYADLTSMSRTSVMSERGLTDIVLLHPSFLKSPFDQEEGGADDV